jgi:[pyruvate, water dikinase]-phosphate phosphotransferase / [pyruvate, water dikinase] kinase
MHHILAVSDGTGGTASRIVDAALTQFGGYEAKVVIRGGVRTEADVAKVIEEAIREGAIVVHTLVSLELRTFIADEARLHTVAAIDLMGPLLAQLSDSLSRNPAERPGLHYKLNREYFRRIEATEFAFRHDDGMRARELDNAEVVLVGVSRTFKTPLSIYLASRGWMVANIPIVPTGQMPSALESIPESRVFFLTTDYRHLTRIRQSRHNYLGGVTESYADPEEVRLELMAARRLHSRHPGWTAVTITNKPIEEIASEILGHMKKR